MKRLLAIGLVVTLGNAPAAFAEESLLASATRLLSSSQTAVPKTPGRTTKDLDVTSFAKTARVGEAVLAQQGGGAVATTGMKKRTKALIYAGVAAAFVGVAYGIDHKVTDVTPSSLGTRQD